MNILIMGPAGAGKTLMTASFAEYLQKNYSIRIINLDSGVIDLPYEPDFDVRDYYTLQEIMKEEGLGPNGATIKSVDMLINLDLPIYEDDFVLIDTPGQLDPFVFRDASQVIRDYSDQVVYLFDGTAPTRTYPSQYLYSLAAEYSMEKPVVRVINKVDLMSENNIEELERLMTDPRMIRETGNFKMGVQMNIDIADMISEVSRSTVFPFVSSENWDGFEDLLTYLLEASATKEGISFQEK